MIFHVFAIVALAVFIGGCGSLYVPPVGADVATLTVRNDTQGKLVPGTFVDSKTCSGVLNFVKGAYDPSIEPNSSIKIAIHSGRDFSLSIYSQEVIGLYRLGICNMVGTFFPKPGASYIAMHQKNSGGCYLSINEELRNSDGQIELVREPSFHLRETKPGITGGGLCR